MHGPVSCQNLLLSIVIPTYNEEHRLTRTLAAAQHYIECSGIAAEVIVSDDGSTDGTVMLASSVLRGSEHQILTVRANAGKGAAVRRGVLASLGQFVLFADADLSTPFETLDRMWPWLRDGYDIVIGSRHDQEADVLVPQAWLRRALGRSYLLLANGVLSTSFSDINCGFKIFRKEVARRLFAEQRQSGWCFDAEILFLAQRMNCQIKEIPVAWHHDEGTKVQVWKDACKSLFELLSIRFQHSHDTRQSAVAVTKEPGSA